MAEIIMTLICLGCIGYSVKVLHKTYQMREHKKELQRRNEENKLLAAVEEENRRLDAQIAELESK